MKALTIRLRYRPTGQILKWVIRRVPRVFFIHPEGPLSKSRFGSGWEYADETGYVRFVEGNWRDLLPRVRLTADNSDCEILTALD